VISHTAQLGLKWDNIIDFDLLWKEYNRIAKGAVVLFSSQPFTTRLINSNMKNYKYTWYWIKNIKGNYLNAKRQPLRQVEEINIFNKHDYYPQGIKKVDKIGRSGSGAKTTMRNYSNEWFQENTGYPSNILYYDLDTDKYHPTQKPVALLEYLINTYTNENDIVLDNCMGSGSTAVAANLTNRKWIGFETEPEYIEIANKRLDNLEVKNK
jgi:site-specific DNA-methyltransferase (adenine-specific)